MKSALALYLGLSLSAPVFGQIAQVRHAPSLNGTVEGSVQQMLPEAVTLNGGAKVTLDLLVPGAPSVRLNGQPSYGGTLDGTGAATPTNYQITLNGNATLRHVVRRTNAVTLPSVAAVPAPSGTTSVTVNSSGTSINWSGLRNLTLNGGVGQFTVPAGTYGDFTANGSGGFTLGIAGATTPSIYNFQHLNLNGSTRFDVVGPVIVNLANGFSANGNLGAAGQPGWLTMNIASGGLTLNGGVNFHGNVLAPNGTVLVNGNSVLVGGVICDRLTVNGGGVLRLQSTQTPNEPPTVAISSPAAGASFDAPASFVLSAIASDADGTITKVEFFQDAVKIGEDLAAPFAVNVSHLGAGSYSFSARATDNAGASVSSASVAITVATPNVPPTVALTSPVEGSTFAAPAAITLNATAADSDGTVAKVEFFQDGAKIGESTAAPFSALSPTLAVGNYVFTAAATDNNGATTTSAPVAVTVIPANVAPVVALISPADGSTFDVPGAFTLQASASDSDGSVVKVEFFRDATKIGEALAAPYALALSGLPAGTYNFLARATDDRGSATDSVGITVTVALINDAPTATPQSVVTPEDTPIAVTLAGVDPESDPLTFAVTVPPQHGTLGGVAPNLTYTPAPDYAGPDSFAFTVSDGALTSAPATISLTVDPVNDRPVATPRDITLAEDTSAAVVLAGADAEGSPLSFIVQTQPQHGTLTGSAPNLTYTPASNYFGTDAFTYAVSDGSLTSVSATVTLHVDPVNDAPVAQSASYTLHAGAPLPLVLSGTDVDGDALAFGVTHLPQHGTLSGTAPNLVYTPTAGYAGPDSFGFTVADLGTTSAEATISLTVANNAPVAQGQTILASEDTPKPLVLTAQDADGDALTYEITVPPVHGTLSGTAPNLTYTPAPDYHGADEFAFRASDGVAASPEALVAITVESLNDAPIALSFSRTVSEGHDVDATLVASDADNDPLTYTVLSQPAHGTLTGTPPALSYRPNDNFGGTDSFTYKANDGTADSNVATVTFEVTDLNQPPTADAQSVTTPEDSPKAIVLTGSDPDNDALSYAVTQPPSHGTLSGTAPDLIYTPHDNFNGNDSFRFTVSDGTQTSAPAVVSIHVDPVNDAPIAAPAEVAVVEDTPTEFDLIAGDPDGDALTYAIMTPPAHGTVSGSLTGPDPRLTYTPAPNFHGSDSLLFKVSDGTLESVPAEIRFVISPVNDAPSGANFTVSAVEDTPVAFSLIGTDVDSDAVTFQLTTAPAHGTLAPAPGGYVYTPAPNFNGPDSFTYRVSDGTLQSDPYTVTLEVAAVNDAPVATSATASTLEDVGVAITLTGSDVETDPLGFRIVVHPAHGLLTGSGANWLYTPAPNYNGPDEFAFVANDGQLDSASATVTLNVVPVNDAPVALAQSVVTPEDTAAAIALGGSDVDGDALTYVVTTPPQHGVLSGTGRDLVYTPTMNYNGPDAFAFTVSDGALTSAPASVTLDVTPVNDPPVASAAAITTDEDVPVALALSATDVDGDALTFSVATPPAHGALSGTAPNLTYTPAANYHGTDSFTFTAHDGTVASSPATVALTINSVNDAPTADSQSLTTAEDTAVSIALTGADVDGDALTFVVTQPPVHGALSGAAPNLTYTPAPNYNGSDVFRFVASDGSLTSPETAVTLAVTPVNDAPVATPATYATTTGQPLSVTLAGTDVDGDSLSYTVVTQPTRGTLTGTPPNLVYTSAPDFGGFDSFTFRVSDGALNSAPATVQLTAGLPPRSRTYTTTADFAEGTLFSLSTETADELTNKVVLSSFDAVWVANSQKGTVVKIDPDTGRVLGEFLSKPSVAANTPYPSRIAVDSKGNVWVANYSDNSLIKIGIPENGYWVDRNGNGRVDTSGALGDVLAWDADNLAAATDEAILLYVRTDVPGVRHLSVDADDNVWVGGAGGSWQRFDGNTGALLRSEPAIGMGGQGGFIAADGKLYSAGSQFLIWQTDDPIDALPQSNSVRDGAWASALDSKGNLWVTKDWTSTIIKYAPDGTKLGEFYHGEPWAMGIAIDANDHIWVAHSHCGHSVGHLLSDGTLIGNVEVANHGPVEVSIDRRGRIWVVSSTGVVERINPLGGALGSDGQTPIGEVDTTTGNLGGALWTYGRFTGSSTALASPEGRWTIVHDGQLSGTTWGPVVWDAQLCNDGNVAVEAALSADGVTFGAWQTLSYANPTPSGAGRYLKLRSRLVSASTGEPPVLYSVTVGTAGYAAPTIAPSWTVSAGADIEGNWPDSIQLKGAFCHSAHDFPTAPTYAWSVVSGPAAVTFDNPASPRAKAQFGGIGTYVLRLTATLDGVIRTDDLTISLTPYNRPPYVNAGYTTFRADLPPQLWLWGTVRDDGLPNGAPVTSTWSKLFGPGTVAFANASAPSTTATFSAPGVYVLSLSASDTALTSTDVTTVWLGYSCIPVAPDGIVSWWQASANGDDHVGGNQAFTERGTNYAEGKIGGAFRFDAVNDRVRVFAAPTLDVGAGDTAGFALELWVNPSAARTATIFEYSSGAIRGFNLRQIGNRLEADFRETNNTSHILGVDGVLPTSTWTHVAATYDRVSGEARLYVNGSIRVTQAIGSFTLRTNLDVNFGGQTANAESFGGLLDEISVYKRAIYADEVNAIYAHPAGKRPPVANVAPIVDAGPTLYNRTANTVVALNGSVTDDGQPVDGVLTSKWTKLSGPGGVAFANDTSPQTTATFSEGGIYLLQLEADDGGFCSKATVEVRVDALYKVEPDPATVAAWWPFNKNDVDVVNGLKMELFNGAALIGDGRVSRAVQFDGTDDFGRVRAVPQHNLGASVAGFTVEFWARPTQLKDTGLVMWRNDANAEGLRIFEWNSGAGLHINLRDTANNDHAYDLGGFFTANTWVHFALTYDKSTGWARIYRNGVLFDERAIGVFTVQTTYPMVLGARLGESRYYQGQLDELTLYSRPLTITEIAAIANTGAVGKAPPDDNQPPLIDAGPDIALSSTSAIASLQGSVTDDGRPAGGTLSIAWSKVDGPGTVQFGDLSQAATTAQFSAPGVYLLRLDANDGLNQGVGDLVRVSVGTTSSEPQPLPPLAAWWPGNGSGTEIVRGHANAELYNGAAYTAGKVSQAFDFDGVNDHARIPAHADHDLGASAAGFTVEFWARPTQLKDTGLVMWRNDANAEGLRIFEWNSGAGLHINLRDTANNDHAYDLGGFFTANTWVHFALTYDKSTGWARIYRNGVVFDERFIGSFAVQTTYPLVLGARLGESRYYQGQLDELTLYTRPLSITEIATIYAAGADGKTPPDDNLPPVVSAGPDLNLPSIARTAALAGSVTDDNKPMGPPSVLWSVVDGPTGGSVTFADATSATTTAQFSAPGTYLLRLTATEGYVAPVSDVVEVRVATSTAALPSGAAVWWPGNGTGAEVLRGHANAELYNGAAYTAGKVSQAFDFDGVNDHARIPAHADHDLGASVAGFTVEFWARPTQLKDTGLVMWRNDANAEGLRIFEWNSGAGLHINLRDTANNDHAYDLGGFFTANTWVHFALTYDKATGWARIYRNGVVFDERFIGNFTVQTTFPMVLGARLGESRYFQGQLDELTLYTRPLAAAEIAALHAAGASGKTPPGSNEAPVVFAGPDVAAASVADSVTLQGTVDDDGPASDVTVQWTKLDGPGAVQFGSPNALVTTATFDTAGTYLLQLSASDGNAATVFDTVEVRVGVAVLETHPALVAWWTGNSHGRESVHGQANAELLNGAGYAVGKVSQAFNFDGVNDHARIPAHADHDLGASAAGFTVEFWARPTQLKDTGLVMWRNDANAEGMRIFEWNSGAGLHINLRDTANNDHTYDLGGFFTVNTWVHFALTYDKSTGWARIYRNGVLFDERFIGSFAVQTTYPLVLGARLGESRYYQGQLDEIALYSHPLSITEIAAIHNAGNYGRAPLDDDQAPVVSAGPNVSVPDTSTVAALAGSVSDDGKPFGAPAVLWSVADAPAGGSVTFADASSVATTATFSTPGTYLLRLTASEKYLAPVSDLTEVRVATTPAAALTDLAVWWPGNGTGAEVLRGHANAELYNGAAYTAGKVSQAFDFDGVNDHARIPAHADHDLGASAAGFTVEFWARPTQLKDTGLVMWRNDANAEGLRIFEWNSGAGLHINLRDTANNDHFYDLGGFFTVNTWVHFALTYDKSTGWARIYRNGVLFDERSIGIFAVQTTYPLVLGARLGESRYYQGQLDELTLYTRPLSITEIAAIYNADTDGKTPPTQNVPPTVLLDAPVANSSVVVNTSLSLSAVVSDTDGTIAKVEFFDGATKIGESTAADAGQPTRFSFTVSAGLALGAHTLTARATDDGGAVVTSSAVALQVVPVLPVVSLTAPLDGANIAVGLPLTLTAEATYSAGVIAKVEFYDGLAKLGEATAPTTGTTYSLSVPAGLATGSHRLTARAYASASVYATSAPVNVTAAIVLPVVALTDPANNSSIAAAVPLALKATATTAAGTIAKVEFYDGSVKLGERTAADPASTSTYTFNYSAGLGAGAHTLTAKATSSTGSTATSAAVAVTAGTYTGAPEALILTPGEDTRISAPVKVTGVVAHSALTSWVLDYRLKAADGDTPEAWTQFATGANLVGTPANGSNAAIGGELGTFDPTLLLNGIYEIRLRVTDASNTTLTAGPITVVVEGNMKVGAFTLAFEDLKLPLPGIPISITRTYDSRDARVGDFGPAWRIAVANVRVQKNRNLGTGWWQTPQSGNGIQFYYVEPVRERIVTVTMPDGETHRFRAGAYVKNRSGDPDNASFAVVVRTGKIKFYPLGDTTSTLEPLDAAGALADDFWIAGTGDQDITAEDPVSNPFAAPFNPTRFRLTTKDGTRYLLDERLGLLELRDLNDNTLVVNRDAQNRVSSIVSTLQTSASTSTSTSVSIHRDALGRVDYIRDPAGHDLDYLYDAQGRLDSFTNREGNTTQFRYENTTFPHYLTRIIDPRGIAALRSEFDADGRLVKQIDADGKETVFVRGIDTTGRFEKVTDRLGKTTTFYYDDRGNVTTKIDALGGITTFAYDADDNQISMTDPLGRTSTMTYDAKKNVLSQTDARGKTTSTLYNALGVPTRITDPDGRVQTFTYDPANNNLLTHTVAADTPQAATTTFVYDSAGRLTQSRDALNQTTTHTHGADGRIATTTNALGHATSFTYDANGNPLTQTVTRTKADGTTVNETTTNIYDSENRLTKTTFPDGTFVETTYNAFGKTASTKDQLGRVTSFTYDARGNLTRTDYPDGTFETTAYDLENRVTATANRNGHTIGTTYDALGRVTRVTAADGTFTQTAYDVAGQVTSTTDARGNVTTFAYDAAGRRTAVKDALNQTTTYAFDDSGNQTGFTDALGRTTTYAFDARGQRTSVTFHDGTTQTTTYDALGRKVADTDQEGKITRYRHDALGRLVEVRQYVDQALAAADFNFTLAPSTANVVSTRFAYDELGNRTTQTDALDRVTRHEYDSLGRRVKRVLPDGAFETYAYNSVGNLTARTDFAGKTTTFAYDAQNRLVTKTADPTHPSLIYSHAIARVEYDYDDNGARVAALTYNSSNTLLYAETTPRDSLGRVTSKATPLGTLAYTYHANGLLKDVVSSNANGVNTGYRYDALNRLAFVDDASGADFVGAPVRTTAYTYHAVGSLATVTAANGVRHGYAYDNLNRLTSLSVQNAAAQVLRGYTYTLNPSGHRSQIAESTGRTASYTYDGIYRLTTETVAGDASNNGSIGYTLDKVGNRLNRTSSVSSVPSAANSFNSRDQLSGDGYDANGNTLTSSQLSTLVSQPDIYDFEDRLIVRQKADGSTVNLAYDADGLLRQKTLLSASATFVSATGYLTDSNNLTGYAQVVEEYANAASGVTERVYTYGADLISQATLAPGATASTQRFYVYDGMASVRALTDAAGAITDTWDYDAFGVLLRHTGTTVNDYQYRGERFDSDLGMYSLRARFYNQNAGRFWNADTYEGSPNDPASLHRYLYANAAPVMFSDPSGNFSITEIAVTVSVVSTVALIAYPTVRPVVANVVGYLGGGANARYSLSSLGVYDESAALLDALGLSPEDFSGNLFQDALTELGTDAVVGAISAGTAVGVAKGFAAFRRATPAPQFTKSSLARGQQMHRAYKADLANGVNAFKEFRLPSGRRIDFLDLKNGVIHELKPNNPRAIAAGQRQLQQYLRELQSLPQFKGINWRTVLDTY